MKKLLTLLLTLAVMAVLVTVVAADNETVNLLTPEILTTASHEEANWTWNDDGTVTGANNHMGDTALMSEIFLEPDQHVVIDMVAEIADTSGQGDNPGAFGIMFGEIDPTAPFIAWSCLNVDTKTTHSRLFSPSGSIPGAEPRYDDDEITPGLHHITCEITAENEFIVYYDNFEYGSTKTDMWFGAYLGVMTWWSNTTFKSYTITYVDDAVGYAAVDADAAAAKKAEEEAKAAAAAAAIVAQQEAFKNYTYAETVELMKEDTLKYAASADSSWTWDGGKLVAKNAALGDNAYMSEYRVNVGEHVVITLDATVDAGSAIGIMLGFNDYNDPLGTGWACMNMDISRPSTRLFLFGGPDNELPGDFTTGTPYTISLELTPDGTAWCYLNGELYGGSSHRDGYDGCYVGVMTWFADATFTSLTVNKIADGEAAPVEEPAVEEPVVEEPTYSYPASGESGNSLVGTVIGNAEGWGGNAAAGAAAAFDGNPATFFDPLGQGDGYCGMDMGKKVVLDKVVILSRADWNARFKGAEIRGNNEDNVDTAVTLWKSDVEGTNPDYFVITDFENNDGYQYYFYYNTENHGDVAEVEFYGSDAPAEEAPAEPEAPAESPVDEELEAKAEAPNTFDFGIIAAVAAVMSLAGFAVSKKH